MLKTEKTTRRRRAPRINRITQATSNPIWFALVAQTLEFFCILECFSVLTFLLFQRNREANSLGSMFFRYCNESAEFATLGAWNASGTVGCHLVAPGEHAWDQIGLKKSNQPLKPSATFSSSSTMFYSMHTNVAMAFKLEWFSFISEWVGCSSTTQLRRVFPIQQTSSGEVNCLARNGESRVKEGTPSVRILVHSVMLTKHSPNTLEKLGLQVWAYNYNNRKSAWQISDPTIDKLAKMNERLNNVLAELDSLKDIMPHNEDLDDLKQFNKPVDLPPMPKEPPKQDKKLSVEDIIGKRMTWTRERRFYANTLSTDPRVDGRTHAARIPCCFWPLPLQHTHLCCRNPKPFCFFISMSRLMNYGPVNATSTEIIKTIRCNHHSHFYPSNSNVRAMLLLGETVQPT